MRTISYTILLLYSLVASSQDRYEEARSAFYQGEYLLADQLIQHYLTEKGNQHDVQALMLSGLVMEQLGKPGVAISRYSDILMVQPDHLEARFKRGEQLRNQGIYLPAIEDFDYLIGYEGNSGTKGVFFQIDPEGQEQVKVATMSSMKAQVFSQRGACYQALGDYDAARFDFDQAVTMEYSSSNLINRALLLIEMKDSSQAINDLQRAINLDDSSLAWYNLLLINPDISVPDAVMQDETFAPLITYEAIEAMQNGELIRAEKLIGKALKIRTDDPFVLINAGRLQNQLGQYDMAIEHFMKALTINNASFEAYYLIANAFYQSERYEEAIAYYEQYLARDRSRTDVWYNAALAYREIGDFDSSCSYLNEASGRGMQLDRSSSLFTNCSN